MENLEEDTWKRKMDGILHKRTEFVDTETYYVKWKGYPAFSLSSLPWQPRDKLEVENWLPVVQHIDEKSWEKYRERKILLPTTTFESFNCGICENEIEDDWAIVPVGCSCENKKMFHEKCFKEELEKNDKCQGFCGSKASKSKIYHFYDSVKPSYVTDDDEEEFCYTPAITQDEANIIAWNIRNVSLKAELDKKKLQNSTLGLINACHLAVCGDVISKAHKRIDQAQLEEKERQKKSPPTRDEFQIENDNDLSSPSPPTSSEQLVPTSPCPDNHLSTQPSKFPILDDYENVLILPSAADHHEHIDPANVSPGPLPSTINDNPSTSENTEKSQNLMPSLSFQSVNVDPIPSVSHVTYDKTADYAAVNSITCDKCNKTFSSKKTFERHNLTVHQKLKNHHCEYCKKAFARPDYLQKHQLTKKGVCANKKDPQEKKCDICGKELKNLYELKRHAKIHNKTKEFECPTCRKFFSRRDTLVKHMKTHKIL